MLNAIPVIGWILSLIFTVSLAIPFWLVWSVFGVGETYFYFLPKVYHGVGFWACVGIFMAVSIIKSVFLHGIFSVSSNSSTKD